MSIPLYMRQHHLSGSGWTTYSSTDNTSFSINSLYSAADEISAWISLPRDWLHGKKVRYTRSITGYSGSAQTWVIGEIMDGEYDPSSSVHFPAGAERINLGNGRLVLIETSYADGSNTTKTTGVLDLSGGSQDKVSLCWRIRGYDDGKTFYLTVTSVQVLDASDTVLFSVDIDDYTAIGATSGQNYGTMGTFPSITQPISRVLLQPAGMFTDHLVTQLDELYGVFLAVQREAMALYGLSLMATILQPWRDASRPSAELYQPLSWGSGINRSLRQEWEKALSMVGTLTHPWSLYGVVEAAALQQWPLVSGGVLATNIQGWDLSSFQPVQVVSTQVWGMLGEAGTVETANMTMTVNGFPLDPVSISIETSIDQYTLSASVGLATLPEYLACTVGSILSLTIGGTTFSLKVEGRSRNREHGSSGYTITALSPAAWLDAPYAQTVNTEYSGMASAIASTLAAPLSVSWQTIDWALPASTLIASEETPLSVLRKLAAAVGAVLQSQPDGSLAVIPSYPLSVPSWATSTPADILSDLDDILTAAETYDHRPGYNRYVISDEIGAADTVRLEEEGLDNQRKRIRAYRTPWQPISLRHTGGDWVALTEMGTEEREVEETVEFVAGEGRTKYPIYDRVTMAWQQVSLGGVTQSEDGLLRADVDAESLLALTYRTRCWMWEARSPQIEEVQLVAEVGEV
jgi:hypothetical protein